MVRWISYSDKRDDFAVIYHFHLLMVCISPSWFDTPEHVLCTRTFQNEENYWQISWLIDWLFTVSHPPQEFFTYMETSPLPVKGCKIEILIVIFSLYINDISKLLRNLGLCSALRAFEQGGIFIVSHLLWHGTSVFPISSEGPHHLVASLDTHGSVEDLF
jgi:hypothetical protein